MWDLPGPGLEPVSPALAGRPSTTAPPRKPQGPFLSLPSSTWELIMCCLFGRHLWFRLYFYSRNEQESAWQSHFFLKWTNLYPVFTPSPSVKVTAHLLGIKCYLEEVIILGASLHFQFCRLKILEKLCIIPQVIPNLVWCSWTLKSFNWRILAASSSNWVYMIHCPNPSHSSVMK